MKREKLASAQNAAVIALKAILAAGIIKALEREV